MERETKWVRLVDGPGVTRLIKFKEAAVAAGHRPVVVDNYIDEGGDWLRAEDAEHKLLLEANATTLALGHRMTDWIRKGGRCYARCSQCYEAAVVAARVMGEPTMRGAALSLRCGGKR